VQFIMLMGLDLGIGLLMMRRMGLWQRLRAAPLAKATLVGSRIASGTVIGILVLSIVYAAAIAAFGVRIEGNVIGFFGMIVALALLAATFGLLIAAIGRTPETTRGLAILVTLLLVMLSGAWVPSFLFPEWLQRISLFVPTRWAVDGLDAMTWRGLGIQAVLLPLGVTLGSAILFAAIAINRLSWEE
jgi:ABC-2 type transport system permease protein